MNKVLDSQMFEEEGFTWTMVEHSGFRIKMCEDRKRAEQELPWKEMYFNNVNSLVTCWGGCFLSWSRSSQQIRKFPSWCVCLCVFGLWCLMNVCVLLMVCLRVEAAGWKTPPVVLGPMGWWWCLWLTKPPYQKEDFLFLLIWFIMFHLVLILLVSLCIYFIHLKKFIN